MNQRNFIFYCSLICLIIIQYCVSTDIISDETVKSGNYLFVEDENVLILTRENFHYGVKSNSLLLVMFYAPWCDESKRLIPEYSKAATELKRQNIILAKVDATKEVELTKEFMVIEYPSVILFRNGTKSEEYNGPRNNEAIVKYMQQRADPNWNPEASAVITLTSKNFSTFLKDKEIAVVNFYVPWCKHSAQMAPEYEAAARTLQKYGIPLAKVHGSEEKDLADAFKIPGWPTLKVFRKGHAFDYKGPREYAGIVEHVKELIKPPSIEVFTFNEAKNAMDRTESTIVGFFPPEKSDLYHEYMTTAESLRGIFTCVHTFDPKIAGSFNVSVNSVVVFQPEIFHSEYEEPYYVYDRASGNSQDLIEFIQAVSVPLVGQRTKRNENVKYSTRPLMVVYYDVNFDHQYIKETQYIRRKVLQVAKDYRLTNVKFAICDEQEYYKELQSVNLADVTEDVKVAAFDAKVKFRMDPVEEFTVEEFAKFASYLASGKGKPFLKSQPIPKKQEGPVRVIVADTFETEILKANKDILIEFYAPWCGHCKALEPVYNKLAKKMAKENHNLIVAKMDATVNDAHYMFGELKGYPSIFFLPAADKKDYAQYRGPLTYDDLKDFVDENSSVFLTEEERLGLAQSEQKDEL